MNKYQKLAEEFVKNGQNDYKSSPFETCILDFAQYLDEREEKCNIAHRFEEGRVICNCGKTNRENFNTPQSDIEKLKDEEQGLNLNYLADKLNELIKAFNKK